MHPPRDKAVLSDCSKITQMRGGPASRVRKSHRARRVFRGKMKRFPYRKALTSAISLGILLPPCRLLHHRRQGKTAKYKKVILFNLPLTESLNGCKEKSKQESPG